MIHQKDIVRIDIPTVDCYNPDNEHLGCLNEYEFITLRYMILKDKLEGYYIVDRSRRYNISSLGMIENHPDGVFDYIQKISSNMINLRCRS